MILESKGITMAKRKGGVDNADSCNEAITVYLPIVAQEIGVAGS